MSGAEGWGEGRGWGEDTYGEILFRRAVGDLPEMQSSRSVANRLAPRIRAGDRLLDAGCGAGHYLRSLRNRCATPFTYVGLDLTSPYLRKARQAFSRDPDAFFCAGDITRLPFDDASFDIVMCNNVLLHLPMIEPAVTELCRVARRFVTIRSLVGDRSMIVKDVRETGDEFDTMGNPRSFNFHNIYSEAYIRHITARLPTVRGVSIESDDDFDPSAIDDSACAPNATRVLGGLQVSGYILQPWSFIEITIDGTPV